MLRCFVDLLQERPPAGLSHQAAAEVLDDLPCRPETKPKLISRIILLPDVHRKTVTCADLQSDRHVCHYSISSALQKSGLPVFLT